ESMQSARGCLPSVTTRASLRLIPAPHPRPPATHIPAILFVLCPELVAQRRLFVEDYKQMHTEGNGRHGSDGCRVRVSEHNAQPDPSHREAHIHRVPNVAVEAHDHQPLR